MKKIIYILIPPFMCMLFFIISDITTSIRVADTCEKETYGKLLVIMLTFITTIIIYLHYEWKKRLYKRVSDLTDTILHKQHEIKKLKESSDSNDKALRKLKKELQSFEKQNYAILKKGQELYEEIIHGGNTVTWNKDDYIHFIHFYKLKNPNLILHLEQDYDHLSPRYMTFAILYDMKMSDKEVMETLAISEVTIRSCKARIKSKIKKN